MAYEGLLKLLCTVLYTVIEHKRELAPAVIDNNGAQRFVTTYTIFLSAMISTRSDLRPVAMIDDKRCSLFVEIAAFIRANNDRGL